MFFVAVARIIRPVEEEAPALAKDLGSTPYEARLAISGALPAIVYSGPDRQRATDLYQRIAARGHGAVLCNEADVVPSDQMVSMRRFQLDADGVVAGDPNERLSYDDVFAIIRATHKSSESSRREVTEKKFDMGRAILTQGLVMHKKSTRVVATAQDIREQKAYFFRRSGARPWILSETGTQYAGLGGMLAPTQAQNFLRTIEILRERMRMAVFDDRLLQVRKVPERLVAQTVAGRVEVSQSAGMDLLAHVLAAWIAGGGAAYR